MTMTFYNNRRYQPVSPQPDTDEMAAQGDRLMLRHNEAGASPGFYVAKRGELCSGWTIGIFVGTECGQPRSAVNITLPVTERLLGDVLTTCIESPFGQWFRWSKLRRDRELSVVSVHLDYDTEDADEGTYKGKAEVTRETVRLGIERVLATLMVNAEITGSVLAAVTRDDAGHIDSIGADAVLQAAIYGKVVFG